jgi:hypothetical protein
MEIYDVCYADRGTALVLRGDLHRGWRKLPKTYGFNASQKVYYRGDWSIRAQLSLIAQPATFDSRAASFPDVSIEDGDELVGFALRPGERLLTVKVALKADQPWRIMSTGRPGIYIEELPLLVTAPQLWFDLRAWIVFHGPPPIPVRDAREWGQRMFLPGGRFESNRRRH